MQQTTLAYRGLVTAPHHLAADAGARVLREGGNAVEAMIAAAATVAAVYPHMNGVGGDGFWLVSVPGRAPVGIDACGAAGAGVSPALYRERGLDAIPARGPLAANTVAGTVSGWGRGLALAGELGGELTLERLLEDAIHHADTGVPVTRGQHALTDAKRGEMANAPGFAGVFLDGGSAPAPGSRFTNPALAGTLRAIAREGAEGFYRGALARRIAADLERVGSPLTAADLAAHRALDVTPLSLRLESGTVYNLPPPTQGLASLMILGLYERIRASAADGFDHLHRLVEATKSAFLVRDEHVADPGAMSVDPTEFLADAALDARAASIDTRRASPWPRDPRAGDTVWLGAVDADGRAVSFIQSIYWEFGSGVVLEDSGIQWQNRGSSFGLDPASRNVVAPGKRPFHTLNPALAQLADGRVMSYGTMGGEGQPQTQAAVFTRHVMHGQGLQAAVSAPRWLLGRTWGEASTNLKLESRFEPGVVEALAAAGHDVETVAAYSDAMGHAGAVVHHPGGLLEGAADPRSDGRVSAA